jgi:hypothetical protein
MDYRERQQIIANSPISFTYLKRFNTAAGILHLAQGVLMLILGSVLKWQRNIYTFYPSVSINVGPPFRIDVVPNAQVFATIGYLGIIVASFPLMSAFAHFSIAFLVNKKYNENLSKGMNPYRWYEYAFSSSIMIVLIGLFLFVWDLWSLVMFFVLNAMMIMFGYLMELINQKTEKTNWSAFLLGCVSGGTPWVVIFAYFLSAISAAGTNPPTFVYMILFIYFIMFNIFAVNMVLQYKGVSKWRDYLYGERAYIIFSVVAKSILVWLVFIGVFSPF